MAEASYLARRCLQQIALDEKEASPAASTVVFENFVVDDDFWSAVTRRVS
jgi:hypothetical protein